MPTPLTSSTHHEHGLAHYWSADVGDVWRAMQDTGKYGPAGPARTLDDMDAEERQALADQYGCEVARCEVRRAT